MKPSGLSTFPPPVTGRIGFYGCPAGRGRLVRVGLTGTGKRPRHARVTCPVCGFEHPVSLIWREASARDAGREVEVYVEAAS